MASASNTLLVGLGEWALFIKYQKVQFWTLCHWPRREEQNFFSSKSVKKWSHNLDLNVTARRRSHRRAPGVKIKQLLPIQMSLTPFFEHLGCISVWLSDLEYPQTPRANLYDLFLPQIDPRRPDHTVFGQILTLNDKTTSQIVWLSLHAQIMINMMICLLFMELHVQNSLTLYISA